MAVIVLAAGGVAALSTGGATGALTAAGVLVAAAGAITLRRISSFRSPSVNAIAFCRRLIPTRRISAAIGSLLIEVQDTLAFPKILYRSNGEFHAVQHHFAGLFTRSFSVGLLPGPVVGAQRGLGSL